MCRSSSFSCTLLLFLLLWGNLAAGYSRPAAATNVLAGRTSPLFGRRRMTQPQHFVSTDVPTLVRNGVLPRQSMTGITIGGTSRKENNVVGVTDLTVRGGAAESSSSSEGGGLSKCPYHGFCYFMSSLWCVAGVMYILLKAIRRVVPIALEPFVSDTVVPLTTFQLGAYIFTCVYFAYVEGYKGFQLKFAPLVVVRSLLLDPFKCPPHHWILGPFYAMGLFHATKKRMIVSWGVTLGVAGIVAVVKRLPYPWRNIIDAGVIVGLTWGSLAIAVGYLKGLVTGKTPEGVDPALPAPKAT